MCTPHAPLTSSLTRGRLAALGLSALACFARISAAAGAREIESSPRSPPPRPFLAEAARGRSR